VEDLGAKEGRLVEIDAERPPVAIMLQRSEAALTIAAEEIRGIRQRLFAFP
jgi:hypothetical protein